MQGYACSTTACTAPASNPPFPRVVSCSPRGGVPAAAVPLPAVGHGVERLLGHLRAGLCQPRVQPEPPVPAGDPAAALLGRPLPGPARSAARGE